MNTTDIDDFKAVWRLMDERVERTVAFNRELLRDSKLRMAHSAMSRLLWMPIIELIGGLIMSGIIGRMLWAQSFELRFLLPAVVVQGVSTAMVIAAIRKLHLVTSIDLSEPVAQIQRKLAEYGTLRSWTQKWLLCAAPLLWVPGIIVFARGVWGWDLYGAASLQWLIANFVFGLAVLIAALIVAYRYRRVPGGSPFLQRISDDMAGRSLEEAKKLLEQIKQFEAR